MKTRALLELLVFVVGGSLLVFGCAPSKELTTTPRFTLLPVSTETPAATPTILYTPYARLTPPPPPTPTSTPQLSLCSPLQAIALQDLSETIFNPFNPPVSGSDDPHQGVDFSDLDPVTKIALDGRPVQAVLEGRVAVVIQDRFPYGNAIMIETPLNRIPESWLSINLPSDYDAAISPRLTCPNIENSSIKSTADRSVFLLYAHLNENPLLRPGEAVYCGQAIGQIGNSGNSLNPHLHLEMRIGPAGSLFESMAHYDSSASQEEMANYCLWRVSGRFVLSDPMQLFSNIP